MAKIIIPTLNKRGSYYKKHEEGSGCQAKQSRFPIFADFAQPNKNTPFLKIPYFLHYLQKSL